MPTLYTCRRSVLFLTKPELFRQPFDLSPNQTTCEVYHDAQNERNRHNKKHFRSIQTHPPAAGHRSDATRSAPCETSDRIAAHIAQCGEIALVCGTDFAPDIGSRTRRTRNGAIANNECAPRRRSRNPGGGDSGNRRGPPAFKQTSWRRSSATGERRNRERSAGRGFPSGRRRRTANRKAAPNRIGACFSCANQGAGAEL